MIKVPLFEMLVRGIPEALICVWSILYIADTKIKINKYLLLCMIEFITIYLVRLLPIDYGIHTLLAMFILVIANVKISKINTLKCIRATVLTIIIECISEGIDIIFIAYVLNLNINTVFNNTVMNTLYSMPSLLINILMVLVFKEAVKRIQSKKEKTV